MRAFGRASPGNGFPEPQFYKVGRAVIFLLALSAHIYDRYRLSARLKSKGCETEPVFFTAAGTRSHHYAQYLSNVLRVTMSAESCLKTWKSD